MILNPSGIKCASGLFHEYLSRRLREVDEEDGARKRRGDDEGRGSGGRDDKDDGDEGDGGDDGDDGDGGLGGAPAMGFQTSAALARCYFGSWEAGWDGEGWEVRRVCWGIIREGLLWYVVGW